MLWELSSFTRLQRRLPGIMNSFLKKQAPGLYGLLFGALIVFGIGIGCHVPVLHLLGIIAIAAVGTMIILFLTG